MIKRRGRKASYRFQKLCTKYSSLIRNKNIPYYKMEYVIRDRLNNNEVFLTIFPINTKIDLLKEEKVNVLFYDVSGNMKWNYEKDDYSSSYEKINTFDKTKVNFLSSDSEYALTTSNSEIHWAKNGELMEEIYYGDDGKKIKHISHFGDSYMININNISFLYDLKSFLTFDYISLYPNISKYPPSILREISEGRVDPLELDSFNPDFGVFFYINDDGKVNAVTTSGARRSSISRRFFSQMIIDDSLIREEAEKLFKDRSKYMPNIFSH